MGIFRWVYQCWFLSTNINIIKRINASKREQCIYTRINASIRELLYARTVQNPARIYMPGDLQMLLLDVAFSTLLMQRLLGQQTAKILVSC